MSGDMTDLYWSLLVLAVAFACDQIGHRRGFKCGRKVTRSEYCS